MPKVDLKVPKRSGFNKSHMNLLTTQCGTLTPILVDELIPNTKVYLKDVLQAQLPPLATDTFMRVNLKVEAFFVPSRLLYGGFEQWITGNQVYDSVSNKTYGAQIPILKVGPTDNFGPGTLADYLGFRSTVTGSDVKLNIFPFLAYHRVYDDWYRNTLVQTPVFQRGALGVTTQFSRIYQLPYMTISDQGTPTTEFALNSKLADGVELGHLRQRNFGFDYYTSAMPSPQQGAAQAITFDTSGATGSVTIASIRAANSLQQLVERRGMAGPRYQDFLKSQYGADLSSGVAQRAILLGSGEIAVYSKGIYSSSLGTTGSTSTNNPFADVVGAKFGSAFCNGELTLVDDFTAEEHGYLIVLASLVPIVSYTNGVDAMLTRYNAQNTQVDMANPILQNVGNEPIYQREMVFDANNNNVFGYSDRFSHFKTKLDQLHGLIVDGMPLEAFALQRSITGSPTISSQFLQIPTTYLDQVAALSSGVSQYGMWLDSYHDYRVSMPLAQYSIPSLQDPAYEHGNDVKVEIGGSRL